MQSCSLSEKPQVLTISAASSLRQVLLALESSFERQHPDIELQYNFGGSGALTQQLLNGAPADIIISADNINIERLKKHDLLHVDWPRALLKNRLVLITSSEALSDHSADILTEPSIRKIAIGNPSSAPAGYYAIEALRHFNIEKATKEKWVYAKDVLQVLSYVQNGHVDAGIVYHSDLIQLQGDTIKTIFNFPLIAHSPILYPIAILKDTSSITAAKAFTDFLFSERSKIVFKNYGFKVVEEISLSQ